MAFILLTFFSAFLLEALGTGISVIGLASLFTFNPIIIALAISLDVAKVVSISFLYKQWKTVNLLMRSYMTAAVLVLVLITSSGAFGFLSGEFQKAIAGTNSQNVVIQTLTDEQGRLQKRKEEIDKQIAQLPDSNVRGRTTLMKNFGPEIKRINDRLAEIDTELPKLKIDSIKSNVEVGPIIFIAEAFNTTPEHAVKWVIMIIMFVFDPLAIALLLAGNFLLEQRKQQKLPEAQAPKLVEEEPWIIPYPATKETLEVEKLVEPVVQEEPKIEEEPGAEVAVEPKAEVVEEVIQEVVEEPAVEEQPVPVEEHVAQVEEVPVEQPEQEREIITIDQITKPPKQVHKSSLEDLTLVNGDVDLGIMQQKSRHAAAYRDIPAVTVGGPPLR